MTNYKKDIITSSILVLLVLTSCDKKVSVNPLEIVNYSTGSVFISSVPLNAKIIVDGKFSGLVTPDTIKWLKDGNHKFTLKLDNFLDYTFNIEVKSNIMESVSYNYYSDTDNQGSLVMNSDPLKCSIFLNDSLLTEKTPFTISSLLPANYKIKFSFSEYRSDSTVVKVSAGNIATCFLSLTDTSIWVNYNRDNSNLTNNTVNDILVDDNNLVWLATRDGIIQNNGNYWNNYNTTNSVLANNVINKIKKDNNNIFWIATIEGLTTIENNTWNTYTSSNSLLPGDFVSDIVFDHHDNIWVATDEGLLKISGSEWEIFNTSNSGIPANFVTALAIDLKNNNIWIGTSSFGIAKFDGKSTWKYFQKAIPVIDTGDGISDPFHYLSKTNNDIPDTTLIGNSISELTVDNNGIVWAGFVPDPMKGEHGGVEVYRDSLWEFVDFNLIDKTIQDFYVNDENQIWISTKSGLLKVDNIFAYHVFASHNSGLPTNDISAVYPDNKNNNTLWISTKTNGFLKFKNYKL